MVEMFVYLLHQLLKTVVIKFCLCLSVFLSRDLDLVEPPVNEILIQQLIQVNFKAFSISVYGFASFNNVDPMLFEPVICAAVS